jgi:hypothetical protein
MLVLLVGDVATFASIYSIFTIPSPSVSAIDFHVVAQQKSISFELSLFAMSTPAKVF